MKLSYRLLLSMWVLGLCVAAVASPKEKEKEHEATAIDSGSFGVYQKGHRVGTETFSIYQTSYGSLVSSEFKTENAPTQDVQTSELQLAANGNIRRYEWKELSPEKAQSVILPNEEFLNQRWSSASQEKEREQPYLLAASTNILDDYFFIHREVMAWKFLGVACSQQKGLPPQCPTKKRAKMATLNPHQHSSALLTAEYMGREKINVKNVTQDLMRLELTSDASTWELWLDDQFKVMRISIVGENTIVDRD